MLRECAVLIRAWNSGRVKRGSDLVDVLVKVERARLSVRMKSRSGGVPSEECTCGYLSRISQ
jgi:hypothetical protein